MLDIAQKYTIQLKELFLNMAYDKRYMYYNNGYVDEYEPSDSTWNKHEFVSIDKEGNILGYISYDITRNTYNVNNLDAINFSDNKFTFGKDLIQAITDIFYKYNFNKLNFGVYIGNPIEPTYTKMVKKYGGKIVGIKEKEGKLLDGQYYDYKIYEILKSNFKRPLYTKIN